eukprot:TRINITY_DN2660_c0_g1_i1.p1 TRINITY_DN2660_c0_g1~~TRINITY_DN2660_c0_g1_i1.p1  ORF type:complete len:616 (-),score=150.97 TRINITY_DN2660_c0_g1_i1:141-1988(-)
MNVYRYMVGYDGKNEIQQLLDNNSSLRELHLWKYKLSNPEVQKVSDALQINTSLTKLDLEATNITDQGIHSISEALRVNSVLTRLDLQENKIGIMGAQSISQALRVNVALTELHLTGNGIGAVGVQSIAEALQVNTTLSYLTLSANNLGDVGAQNLSEAFRVNTTLLRLKLRDNQIGIAGVESILSAIQKNPAIIEIALSGNNLSANGANLVVKSILAILDQNKQRALEEKKLGIRRPTRDRSASQIEEHSSQETPESPQLTIDIHHYKEEEPSERQKVMEWLKTDPDTSRRGEEVVQQMFDCLITIGVESLEDLKDVREKDIDLKPVLRNSLWSVIEKKINSTQKVVEANPPSRYLDNIVIGKSIGEGAFGKVYRGVWLKSIHVALKTLKDEIEAGVSKEIELMKKFRHPNIVSYYGIYQDLDKGLYIVTEYLSHGSLLHLLLDRKKYFSRGRLINMAKDISAGMIYLHFKKIVHRDLAARNLLVDENYRVKVADFGLSEKTRYCELEKNTLMPIRWTAPEALRKEQFTRKSDIYSFGCVLFEMFSGGNHPWDTLDNNSQVKKAVCNGETMLKPYGCPSDVFELMCECWDFEPSKRPSFQTILEKVMKRIRIEN